MILQKRPPVGNLMLQHAIALLDTLEIPGDESNPVIDAMWRRAGYPGIDDETPWCGVFLAEVARRCMEPPGGMTPGYIQSIRDWFKGKSPSGDFGTFSIDSAAHSMLYIIRSTYIHTGQIVIPNKPAWARHWLGFGECVWGPGDPFGQSGAKPGDVCILSRSDGGHVGLLWHDPKNGMLAILGGNQSNSVSIKEYPLSRLLGIRRVVVSKP